MNANLHDQVSASSAQYLEALMEVSTAYFNELEDTAALVLKTAHETMDDCVRISVAAVDALTNPNASPIDAKLYQSPQLRILTASIGCMELALHSRREVAGVIAARLTPPFAQLTMPANMNTAMELFSRQLERLSELNAVGLAAATKALSGPLVEDDPEHEKAA